MASEERVFIFGGTGNVGSRIVSDLLKNGIPVTLFTRSPDKVFSLFAEAQPGQLSTVEGDYSDLTILSDKFVGHTRVFLMYSDFRNFAQAKRTIAQYAYDSGIKQIVDLSSFTVNDGWRSGPIGSHHYDGERAILDIPNRKAFVALRPGRFMSNLFMWDSPLATGHVTDIADPDQRQGWISPNDIAAVAALVLREDVHKHGDAVYTLIGDSLSNKDRAEMITRVTGKQVDYKQVSAREKYNSFIAKKIPHVLAAYFSNDNSNEFNTRVSNYISILLDRDPETFENFLKDNQHLLK